MIQKRIFLCILYGLIYSCGFLPPFSKDYQFLLFILRLSLSSVGIVFLMKTIFETQDIKSAFFCFLSFQTSFFISSLFGIYKAFQLTNQLMFFVPALLFLSLGFGALFALICCLVKAKIIKNKIIFLIVFTILWTTNEVVRGELIVRLPLNLTAHIFCFENSTFAIQIIQIVKVLGIYSLSFYWLLFLSSLYSKSKTFIICTICSFSCFLVVAKKTYHHEFPSNNITAVLIQPNIPQEVKLDKHQRDFIFNETTQQIKDAQRNDEKIDLIVLPETAFTNFLQNDSKEIAQIQDIIKNENTVLLFGIDRIFKIEDDSVNWHNSLVMLSKNRVLGIYDKKALLPFGEYIPFKRFIPEFLIKFIDGIDCSVGSRNDTFSIGTIPVFMTKICSETIHKINVDTYAQFIIEILNDGWFTEQIIWQHFAASKLRAVEANLSLLRCSNNGLSCLLNKEGYCKKILAANKKVAKLIKFKAN